MAHTTNNNTNKNNNNKHYMAHIYIYINENVGFCSKTPHTASDNKNASPQLRSS